MRLFFQFIKIHWSANMQYRLGSFIWMINGLIIPLITMSIWLVIGNNQQLELNQSQIVSYYLVSMVVVRLTQSWSSEDLVHLIKEGSLSNILIKPLPLYSELIAKDFANKFIRLVSLTPAVLILSLVLRDKIQLCLDIPHLLLFVTFIILGYLVEHLMSTTVGLLGFWLEEGYGGFMMYYLVKQLFSGALLPLALMPIWLKNLAAVLPFQFLIDYPSSLISNPNLDHHIITNLALLFVWCLITFVIRRVIYRAGIKQYTSTGI